MQKTKVAAELFVLREALSLLVSQSSDAYEPNLTAEVKHLVEKAKVLASWPGSKDILPLQLVFDRVNLDRGQSKTHYLPAIALTKKDLTLPYPNTVPPDLATLKQQAAEVLNNDFDWQNSNLLLAALEKLGAHVSLGGSDISLYDLAKTTSAIACALADNPEAKNLCLIAGDLSGIQSFIYTIASAGALKSLRARSFYLQLVTEEIIYRLLQALVLPRTSIIYTGGGNLYILAPAGERTAQIVSQVKNSINSWLLQEFQEKVFLALTAHDFPTENVKDKRFAVHWEAAIQKLAEQKKQKFSNQLAKIFEIKPSFENCKVCHRDDTNNLKQLQEDDSVLACPVCRHLFALGGKLPKAKAIVRSFRKELVPSSQYALPFKVSNSETVYYHCFDCPEDAQQGEPTWLINSWDLSKYCQPEVRSLFMGDYYAASRADDTHKEAFIRAEELAEDSTGIKRVGYLRMDVDNLGRIFAKGLGEHHNLPRLASLSRQMSYFFTTYLNCLAKDGSNNLPSKSEKLSKQPRTQLLFIYAGGDDLFISGAWDQAVEFAFDIYQSFRAYTGYHPDITLSGGITLSTPKYPLYQAAKDAGDAEKAAKGNGRDSFSLFGEVFKWSAWLGKTAPGKTAVDLLNEDDSHYLKAEPVSSPPLIGVFPIANILHDQLDTQYSRSFVRNLLATAQMQEQALKEAKKKNASKVYQQDLRYYLHLPKVAYTLARLPKNSRGEPDKLAEVRLSLKSPYNAPYFKAIAIWIDLLNRSQPSQTNPSNEAKTAQPSTTLSESRPT